MHKSPALLAFAGCLLTLCTATLPEEESLQLGDFLEQQIRDFKVSFHRTLESERVRRKRDIGDFIGISRDAGVIPERLRVSSQPSGLSELSQLRVSCWTWTMLDPVFFPVSQLLFVVTQDGRFILLNFDGLRFNVVKELAVNDKAYKAQAFSVGGYVWFTVAFEGTSSHWIQMYRYNGTEVLIKQTIPLTGVADISAVYNRGDWYMAVIASDQLVLYEWRQTQLDAVAWASVTGVRSLTTWSFAGAIYIATAVDTGEQASESPLFVYTKRKGKLSRTQVLPTHFSTKVAHFVLEGNDYLLFLCSHAAVIFWCAGDQFVQLQILEDTAAALDVSSLPLPNGEIAIAIAFQFEIRFYLEGVSSEYYMAYKQSVDLSLSAGFLFFFRHNIYYYLLLTFDLASYDLAASSAPGLILPNNVWKLNLTTYYDHHVDQDPLLMCVQSLKDRLKLNMQHLQFVEANIDRVLVNNKEQVVQTPIIIKGSVEIRGELGVAELVLQGHEKGPVPQVTNSDLRADLLQQLDVLGLLEQEVEGLVLKTGDQIINGDLLFQNGFKAQHGQLPFLMNDVIFNGVPISQLADDTLKVHGDQVLWHSLEATQLDVRNVFLDGSVNDIQPADMILLSGNEIVSREIHFSNVLAQDIVLSPGGTINGLREDTFVRVNRPQVIHGVKTFQNLVAESRIVVKGNTGQRDLSEFVQHVLLLDNSKPEDFKNVHFAAPIIVEGDAFINTPINGLVDLNALATKTLDLHSNQVVTGRKIFTQPVFANGDVNVEGLTNGLDVSEQLLTLSTDQHVAGVVTFDSIEIMGNLSTGTINGYDLKQEAVTKEGTQQISGRKEFTQSVHVLLDAEMTEGSTVNGLDLSVLVEAATRTEGVVLFGTTTFHSLVIQELLSSDAINDVSLDHLYHNLWRKSTEQSIHHSVHLHQAILLEDNLEVLSGINGYDLLEDFVHIAGNEEISGYVRFMSSVFIHGGLSMAPGMTINGFDISEFNRSVVPSQRDSVISGHVVIPSLEVTGNLIVNGGLRGIRIDDLLQTDKEQVITGHVTMLSENTEVLGNMFVDILNLERDINGVDFSEFDRHVVYDFESSPIGMALLENKEFIGELVVGGLLAQGRVDGVDIEEFRRSAVLLSSDEEIAAPKNFTAAEFLNGLNVDFLNGVPLEEHLNSVILDSADIITGAKTIAGSVIVNGNLNYKGLLNGVDIPGIAANAAFRDSDIAFESHGVIIGNLVVGELTLAEGSHLDGLPLSQLTFLDHNQALAGHNTFLDEVTVGEITVGGLVNGCNINKLAEEALYLSRPLEGFTGSLSVGSLIVHGDMEVTGRVGGVNVQDLAQNMLSRSRDQLLPFPVRFQHLAAGNIQLNSVNRVDLPAIMKDAVLKSQPQIISGAKAFVHPSGVLAKSEVLILGDVLVDETVNGVDLNELMHVTVLKNEVREIQGLKHFVELEVQGDIFIQGTLNGVSVPGEVILRAPTEHIEAPLVLLEESTVEGQLWVGGHVNGVLFHQFLLDRVTLAHHQEIQATIRFEDTLTTEHLKVLGSVNNIPIEDIVLRRDKVRISGQKTFASAVTITGDLTVDRLNGVDLAMFDRELVRINQPQVITHAIEFVTEVDVQNDLVILESVNDVQIRGLVDEFSEYRSGLSRHLQELQGHVSTLQGHLSQSQAELLNRQFLELLYFEAFQYVDIIITKVFPVPTPSILKPAHAHQSALPEKILGWIPSTCGEHSTVTLEVGHQGHLGHAQHPLHQPGRVIPLVDAFNPGFGSQPLLWTNSTQSALRCSVGLREETLVSVLGQDPAVLQPLPIGSPFDAAYIHDAKLFEDHNQKYMLATYSINNLNGSSTHNVLYRYDASMSTWSVYQHLNVGKITSVDMARVTLPGNEHHLVVALTDGWSVHFYKWTEQAKFELLLQVPSPGAEIVRWIETSESLHLLVANVEAVQLWGATYRGPPLSVYSYSQSGIQWTHNLELPELSHLYSFFFTGETYVVASSRLHQALHVLQWRSSFQGLVSIQEIRIPEITDVTSYWSSSGDFFLLVSTMCQTLTFRAITLGFGHR